MYVTFERECEQWYKKNYIRHVFPRVFLSRKRRDDNPYSVSIIDSIKVAIMQNNMIHRRIFNCVDFILYIYAKLLSIKDYWYDNMNAYIKREKEI